MPDDPGERSVIQTLLTATRRDPSAQIAPGDDAAVLNDGTVLTLDTLVEGVHWDTRMTAADVGARLALVNRSDLAAMGATGTWALCSVSLPKPLDTAWVQDFARGLAEGLGLIPLVGGDTTASPGPRMVSLTLGGRLAGPALTRSGGRPGDVIWVSGTLGRAAGGYAGVPELLSAFRRPAPPLALGPALSTRGLASAAMDLSDGLATDLHTLCAASGCGARLDPVDLPVDPALAGRPDPVADAVRFGEDFELLFTSPAPNTPALRALGTELGLDLHPIGVLTPGDHVELVGRPWPTSWSHFGTASA